MRKTFLSLLMISSFFAQAQVKPTSASERLKSIEIRKQLSTESPANKTSFRNIGPTVQSGRVVDMDVNPSDPTEFYVAYATGGLWQTTNNGMSFTPIFDSEDIIGIGDIAVNWKTREIWVGTGEVNSSRSTYAGLGVYKSVDNGKSWTWLGLPESHHIGEIKLHSTDPNTAWVAVLGHLYSPNKERGVYKTTDGGKTWKQTLYIDENTGAVDLDINPSNPNELYAGMWYRTRKAWNFEESGKSGGIFKSTDGGETWQKISVEGAGFPTGDGVGRIGLAIYPKNPNIVYAVVDNNEPRPATARANNGATADTGAYTLNTFQGITKEQFAALDDKKLNNFIRSPRYRLPAEYTAASIKEGVASGKYSPNVIWDYFYDANAAITAAAVKGCELYRSDDGGKTWKKTHNDFINIYSSYGYYFGKVFVSPVDENKVVLTGVDLLMSTDGGKKFTSIDGPSVHSDHHAFWFSATKDGHVINGNDGGLNMSYDYGKNWSKLNSPSVGQFYAIEVDMATPYNVYGGLQDNGTWYGSSKNVENIGWHGSGNYAYKSINGGDGMQVQVDWRDNRTVYSGSQFGNYNRQVIGAPASGERGPRGVMVKPNRALGESPLRFNWQSPIILSRHNQDVFYFGSNKFHRSLNKGENMVAMSGDLTTNPQQGDVPFGTLSTISESPMRFGLIYTGSDDGLVHVTKDGGYSWTNINGKLPKGLYVSRVVASKFKESRVYVTLNGYRNDHFNALVYVSEDYGNTWKQIAKDLPYESVNVLREDPVNENILYIGTDGGLYVSLNGGNSSIMWNKGLPYSIPVHDIAIHPRDNEIVLGTHGRSLYVASLSEIQKAAK